MSFKKCALQTGITSEDMAEIRQHIRIAENDVQGVQNYLDGIDADLNDLRNQTGTQLVTEQVETAGETITGGVVDLIQGLVPDTLNQAQEPTESAEFKSWFGDSKVVNETGEPRVVYHGSTKAGFTEFDTGGRGKTRDTGAFFTSSSKAAETYSNTRDKVARVLASDIAENPEAYGVSFFEEDGEVTASTFDGSASAPTREGAAKTLLSDGAVDLPEVSGNYETYLSIKNPLIIDAEGANWDSIGAEVEYFVEDIDSFVVEIFSNEADAEHFASTFEEENGYYPDIKEEVNSDSAQSTDDIVRVARATGDYDGVIIENVVDEGGSGGVGEDSTVFVAFSPEQIKSVENRGTFDPTDPDIFRQDGKSDPRGQIAILPDSAVIKLFEAANRSTFLHEAGHLFLDMTGKLYNHERVTPEIKEDGDAILEFLGVDSFDNITVDQHEKWARAQEKYFGEGKAPSLELQGAFRRFSQWLKHIYISLKNLNVELTDDIRQVMDRMLATDDQIDRIRGSFKPLFVSAEDAGMTKSEFKAYEGNASPEAAKEELFKKLVKELRRKEAKFWKDEKAVIQKQITNEMEKMPVYSAEKYLRGKEAESKILKSEVKALFPGKTPRRLSGMVSDSGTSAEILAPMFGFASGEEMINNISNSKTIKQQASEIADIEMMERHGDILNDGHIETEAEAALRNESRAKKLLAELRALGRKSNKPAIDRGALKEYAKSKISGMKIRSIYPAQFRAAEIRSARAAAIAKSKGDIDGAQQAKTRELINFYLGKEASLAKDKAEKIRASHKAIQAKKYDPKKYNNDPYVNEAKVLIRVFDFRRTSREKTEANRVELERARLWIESQQVQDPEKASPYLVQAEILGRLIPYAEMTVEDLSGLNDTVLSLMKAARETSKNSNKAFKDEMDGLAGSVAKNRIEEYKTEVDNDTPYVKARQLFDGVSASLRKLDSFARQSDAFIEQGPVWKKIIKPLLDASNKALTMRNTAGEDLKKIFHDYQGVFGNTLAGDLSRDAAAKAGVPIGDGNKKTFKFESGKTQRMSYGSRIAVALNMGNAGNHDAMTKMSSMPLTDNDINSIVATLSDKDWDLVQNIWDYIDTYWPMAAELEKSRSGAAPIKVSGRSFVTPSGREMKGGYYPLSGDPAEDTKLGDTDTQAAKFINGGAVSKATKTGSLIERTQFGGKKINFSINVVFNHIDEVIHDVSHWQAVHDVSRVLNNHNVNGELTKSLGPAGITAMQQRIKEIAAGPQRIDALTWWERPLRHARLGVTYGALGYSISTSLKNIAGLTTSVPEVGTKHLSSAVIEWASNPIKAGKFVTSKSEYMVERSQVINRDIAQIRASIRTDGVLDTIKDYSFWFMTQTDKLVTQPIWMAAYEKGQLMLDTEEEVIDYADQTVRRTQGSGDTMDLSSVETRSELMKTMTIMYSAMNAIYGIATEQRLRYKARGIEGAGSITTMQLFSNIMWITVAPGLLMAVISNSDEDDEPEKVAENIIGEVAGQTLGLVPIARDIYSLTRYGSSFPTPVVDVFSSPAELVKQIKQGDVDKGLIRGVTGMLPMFLIPGSSQINRTLGYTIDLMDGEVDTFSPWELLVTGKE